MGGCYLWKWNNGINLHSRIVLIIGLIENMPKVFSIGGGLIISFYIYIHESVLVFVPRMCV